MPITDELLWRAIEGALGAEKRAFLQNAPLTELLGGDARFALPHAMAAVAASGHRKHAENESIRSGLQALAMVSKEAQVAPAEPFLQKVARAHKLRILEPAFGGGQKQAAVQERRRLGAEIMETVKTAGKGTILDGIVSNPTLRDMGKKMLGGGAVAAGAAVPTAMVGSHLSDKFTEDARDRALQTAGGVAGIGMLGYGAKKLMDQAGEDRSRERNFIAADSLNSNANARARARAGKFGSEKIAAEVYASMNIEEDKVAHMATCAYVDEQLAAQEQTHKVAALRDLNNEFLVELLATSVKTAT
jgi:hypothetical protein